jgi:hypothetical protein
MTRIYKTATRVVAWLGPKSDDSDLAFDFLESTNANVAMRWPEDPVLLGDDSRWTDYRETIPLENDQLLALANLLRRSWFERLWIWQEIRLGSENAVLNCGRRSLSWTSFCNACIYLFQTPCRKPLL